MTVDSTVRISAMRISAVRISAVPVRRRVTARLDGRGRLLSNTTRSGTSRDRSDRCRGEGRNSRRERLGEDEE